jgi:hypothetical protein
MIVSHTIQLLYVEFKFLSDYNIGKVKYDKKTTEQLNNCYQLCDIIAQDSIRECSNKYCFKLKALFTSFLLIAIIPL